jgi:hypothetical protein
VEVVHVIGLRVGSNEKIVECTKEVVENEGEKRERGL